MKVEIVTHSCMINMIISESPIAKINCRYFDGRRRRWYVPMEKAQHLADFARVGAECDWWITSDNILKIEYR